MALRSLLPETFQKIMKYPYARKTCTQTAYLVVLVFDNWDPRLRLDTCTK